MSKRNEQDVIVAAQRGDRCAREKLARTYLPRVYNVVGRALGDHPDIDDVVQEVMLRVMRNLPALRQPESIRAWVLAINHRARDRRTPAGERRRAPDRAGRAVRPGRSARSGRRFRAAGRPAPTPVRRTPPSRASGPVARRRQPHRAGSVVAGDSRTPDPRRDRRRPADHRRVRRGAHPAHAHPAGALSVDRRRARGVAAVPSSTPRSRPWTGRPSPLWRYCSGSTGMFVTASCA